MKAKDKDIQTPKDREKALRKLGEHVFFQFCDKAMNKKSGTFGGKSPVEYAKKGVEEFREVESVWLPYEREDEDLSI